MKTASVKIRLHTVSPIHVGSGEVFEPTSFYIDTSNRRLCLFDPSEFVASLNDTERREFSDVCLKGELLQVMKAIHTYAAKAPVLLSLDVPEAVSQRYESVLNMSSFTKEVINRFTLSRSSYCPNGLFPYVPGSSLKGSLRTAYLNALNAGSRDITDSHRARDLERNLLGGSFDKDPFRMLKVPDLMPADYVRTRLMYAVNRKKKPLDTERELLSEKGPDQILEVIEPGSVFEGVLSLDMPPRGSGIKRPLVPERLFAAVQKFYVERYESDRKMLSRIGQDAAYKELDERLDRFKDSLGQQAFMIRLGRHSGAESLTLDGIRSIKIMKGRPPVQSEATTVWLAAESRDKNALGTPFGWAVIVLLPYDSKSTWMQNPLPERLRDISAASGLENRRKAAAAAEERREQERQAREAAEREAEEMRRREAEAQERLRAEEERRARLSPLEREMEEVIDQDKDQNKKPWMKLLSALTANKWSGDDARKVAERIYADMQREGEWIDNPDPKKAGKNKAVKRTLEVMNFLKG